MKVRLTVEENVTYTTEIIVEQPETMDDADFVALISEVESRCKDGQGKDIAYLLEHAHGLKVHEIKDGFLDSPDSSELEIIDISNVKG